MGEPRRHSPSSRSARKALRQAGRVREELEYLTARLRRLLSHIEYASKKADKLRNRLKAPARPKGR